MSDLSFQRRVAYAIGGLGTIAASASTCFAADAGAGVLFGATLVGKALDLGSGKVIDKAFEGFGSANEYRTVLLNHDLQRVLGASVADVLDQVAKELDLPWEQDKALKTVAEEARQHQGFFNEQAFLDLFGGTTPKPDEIATQESWRAYLDWLIGKLDHEARKQVTKNTRARAAEALHVGFAQAVTDTVTRDTTLGRKAFAKLNLLLLGETLRRTRRQPSQPESGDAEAYTQALTDTQAHLAALDGVLDDLATDQRETLGEILLRFDDLDGQLRAQTSTLLARFDALDAGVRKEGVKTRDAVQEDGAQTRAAVREDGEKTRTLLRDALAAIPSAPAAKAVPDVVDVFLGRDVAVGTLRALLTEHRVVNLTGMGGIGKTEVARALGQALQHDGEVWYTDLNTTTDRTELEAKVIGDWDLRAAPTTERLAAQLDTDRLYILDDVEQALDDPKEGEGTTTAAWLHTLTQHAKKARFLITSRRVLDVGHVWELGELDAAQATELFDTLAEQAQPGVLRQANYATLRDSLLPHLEGIPLALTLMAAQLDACTMAHLVDDWKADSLAVAEVPGTSRSPKDRSLLSSLALSHDSLPENGPARTLFALFADLPAGATKQTLRALGGRSFQQAAKLLLRRALLRVADGRYTMRVPIREYAAARSTMLQRQNDRALNLARESAAEYWYRLTEYWGVKGVFLKNHRRAIRVFDNELLNIHSALDRASERGDWNFVVEVTYSLITYYLGNLSNIYIVKLRDAAGGALKIGSLERYAQLQKCIGDIERLRSNYDKAIGIYNSILFIFNILNIKLSNIKRLDTEIANVYKDKGYIYQTLGNANRSIYNYRLAEKNYRSVGEWYGVALAKRAIGYIIVAHNPDDIKGVGMLIESLRFFIKNKYYGAMTTCLESLSNVCIAKGDFDSAMEHLNMSINIVGIKNIGGGNSLRKRGLLYMTLGDYDKSEVDLLESARVFRSLKSLRNEALVFSDIGELYGITNRYGDAVEAYERSVQLYGAVGLEQGRLDCQNRLAEIRARMQS